ncbi:sensor histidine kinase [Limibacter armeniacum]|uniref:sensor histidine kinase n=1 Tax=Limibacter armeniacum TaxID=466084 RepID=UPI002FE6AD8A
MKNIQKPIVYHALFWIGYFLFNTFKWGNYFHDYYYSFKSNLLGFSIHIVLCYFHAYYLLPKFIPQKKYITYFLLLLLSLTVMLFVKVGLTWLLVTTNVWPESNNGQEVLGLNHILTVMIGELYVIGITTSIKLTIDWLRNQQRTRELEKQHMETELNLLKSQMQPHFFFNTLNNLYSLTLIQSPKAPDTVLKLSELMSYMLYQKDNRVLISDEIKHLQNYLDLEKLRFGRRLHIDFEIEGDISGKKIVPLIFLPFIENVFKHGVKNQLNEIHVRMSLQISDNHITFTCQNPNPVEVEGFNGATVLVKKAGGLGLKNAKRRLDLLFEDRYSLTIDDDQETYTVTLKIPLE